MYSATIEMIFLNSTVLGHNTGLVDGTSSECSVANFAQHQRKCQGGTDGMLGELSSIAINCKFGLVRVKSFILSA